MFSLLGWFPLTMAQESGKWAMEGGKAKDDVALWTRVGLERPIIVFCELIFDFEAILDIVVSFCSIFCRCFLRDPIVFVVCPLGN